MLALAAGGTDALCLLQLGGVFASVITGNLVLLAASVVQGSAGASIRAGVAVGAYAVAVFAGGRVVAGRRSVPRSGIPHAGAARNCLALEAVLLAGLYAGWLATGGRPQDSALPWLLALAGAAMGLQSVAVRALGRPGLSTTYLTGAVTRLISTVGDPGWWRRFDRVQSMALLGLVLGAGIEAVLLRYLPGIGPLPAVLLTAGAALYLRPGSR